MFDQIFLSLHNRLTLNYHSIIFELNFWTLSLYLSFARISSSGALCEKEIDCTRANGTTYPLNCLIVAGYGDLDTRSGYLETIRYLRSASLLAHRAEVADGIGIIRCLDERTRRTILLRR